ncbi:LytR/AlgR family response regulator transcription factor [Heyndrickxia ginsengihumi]|uniref:LytR/AlgR family response regulator transcription factor n=1 Tax=Heyndrickxia ginsengihumi TaxID=363870 RepID=UPI003462622F
MNILHHFLKPLSNIRVIAQCHSSDELRELVRLEKPDLLLLDIQISNVDGIRAVQDCLMIHPDVKVIFITKCDEYAIEAFRMNAVDYILKPIERLRLYQAINKAESMILYERRQMKEKNNRNLIIKDHKGTTYVPLQEIIFIEKYGAKCLVYTKEWIYETNGNLGDLMTELDDYFFLAHRSYIINLTKISQIVMKNDTYTAQFWDFEHYASISKLRIKALKEKMLQSLHQQYFFI